MKSHISRNQPQVTTVLEVLETLRSRGHLLPPVAITALSSTEGSAHPRGDALIQASWGSRSWTFAGVAKARSTPLAVSQAMEQARMTAARAGLLPLVCVPFLSHDAVQRLEDAAISGVDLCGNGILIDPTASLLVRRTGEPNLYPTTFRVRDPYSGQAGVVVRQLTTRRWWTSLTSFHTAAATDNRPVALSLCSKVISQLVDLRLVRKQRAEFGIIDLDTIVESLREAWNRSPPRREFPLTLPEPLLDTVTRRLTRRWVISGSSSVGQYALMAQGGPMRVYVEDMVMARNQIGGTSEQIPSFANLVLVECREAGVYGDATLDERGVRWASPLQTWIELRSGDARQQDTATAVYRTMRERFAATSPPPPADLA